MEAAEAAKAAPEAKVLTTEIGPEAAVPVVTETKAVSSPNPIKGDVQISPTQAVPQTTAHQHQGRVFLRPLSAHSSHYP